MLLDIILTALTGVCKQKMLIVSDSDMMMSFPRSIHPGSHLWGVMRSCREPHTHTHTSITTLSDHTRAHTDTSCVYTLQLKLSGWCRATSPFISSLDTTAN